MASVQQLPQPKTKRIGVLFVHGIGEQNRGDTLLSFGEPLFRWLCTWLSKGSQAQTAPDLRLSATNLIRPINNERYSPALTHLSIKVPAPETGSARADVEWLLAESWWAQDFTPPSFGQLAGWAFGIGPWMIQRQVRHLWDRTHQTVDVLLGSKPDQITNPVLNIVFLRTEQLSRWSTRRARRHSLGVLIVGIVFLIRAITLIYLVLRALLQLVLGLIVTFVVQLLTLSLLLLAWIPPLQRFFVGAQRALANSIGDSYILVTSPFRFNAMLSQVQHDLCWLEQQRCDAITVIAHSQGAAVAYEALKHSDQPKIDLFVTFGSGLSKLKAIQSVLPYENAIRLGGVLGFFGMPAFLAGLLGLLKQTSLFNILPMPIIDTSLALILLTIGFILIGLVSLPILRDRIASLTEADLKIRRLGEAGGIAWRDYYASSDPVPDGPLPPNRLANVSSEVVYNQASWLRDHSLYWDNSEQFVSQIACLLAEQSGWSWSEDQAAISRAMERRAPRVAGLMLARSVCLVSVVIAGWERVNPWLRSIGVGLRTGSNLAALLLPDSIVRVIQAVTANADVWLGRLGVALAILVWYWLIRAVWLIWDRAETGRMFKRQLTNSRGSSAMLFFLVSALPPVMGCIAWFVHALNQGATGFAAWALITLLLIVVSVLFGWLGLNMPVPTKLRAENRELRTES